MAEEKLDLIRDEVGGLIEAHWREIALHQDKVPLDPDWELYEVLDTMGRLVIFTARVGGELVGYSAFILAQALHYKTLQVAESDVFFLREDCRKGLAGARLFRYAEDRLREHGVGNIVYRVKVSRAVSPLLNRMGYQEIERVHSKLLEG
jgi:GNAT superfamily N-acetyltransferase